MSVGYRDVHIIALFDTSEPMRRDGPPPPACSAPSLPFFPFFLRFARSAGFCNVLNLCYPVGDRECVHVVIGHLQGVYSMTQKKSPSTDSAKTSSFERAAGSFKKLTDKSKELRGATLALATQLNKVEEMLQPLSLVSAWCTIAHGHDDDSGYWWSRDIGYTVIRGRHYIALKTSSGDQNEERSEEVWKFQDAPHWMQIESVSKIPDLLEVLIERVDQTITKMKAKTDEAASFVAALAPVVEEVDW